MPLSTTFHYIVAASFIGGGNRSPQRKLPTCHKSLTNYHVMLYQVHLAMNGVRTDVSGNRHWLHR